MRRYQQNRGGRSGHRSTKDLVGFLDGEERSPAPVWDNDEREDTNAANAVVAAHHLYRAGKIDKRTLELVETAALAQHARTGGAHLDDMVDEALRGVTRHGRR